MGDDTYTVCAQPYSNDDSHRQGGRWPGDTVNGKTRKNVQESRAASVCVCVIVFVVRKGGGVYVRLCCRAHHL